MRRQLALIVSLLLLLVPAALAEELTWENFPRITTVEVEELQRVGKVYFLDTRTGHDWAEATEKIPGSRRVADNQDFAGVIETIPNDAAIVTYCT